MLHFVETTHFTRLLFENLSDESYRALQLTLILRPEHGSVIPGSGGLRKIRWARAGRGKRGGVRVIYYWNSEHSTVYLLFLYRKNESGDLSKAQIRVLRRLVEMEFDEETKL